ncbi:hypothetical protein NPIL_98161 [Nephila pilipes]|uniref:Uncharacterized protein n=1 Tax=Nephila pilipes TaxID=299642 RepID=A0A8X6NDV3_NEPPI|nr:hypothetical protein NPIL_98161 [Nephila pilipes]
MERQESLLDEPENSEEETDQVNEEKPSEVMNINCSRDQYVRKTDKVEIRALFELLSICGWHDVQHIWASDGKGIEMLRNTMSYRTFFFSVFEDK